jgi:hypothetical protein
VALPAGAAWAASPTIKATIGSTDNVNVTGSGFTPGGQVHVQLDAGTTVISATNVAANLPSLTCTRGGLKPFCVSFPGGYFATSLIPSQLGCGEVANGLVQATDLATDLTTEEPISWVGAC